MKTFFMPAVSIVLVSILFCPLAMSAPPMPNDVQIVEPDPSLPKELSAFWGKWEWTSSHFSFFLIVEKIDQENASLYIWRGGSWPEGTTLGWTRSEAKVYKERGKYKLWFRGPGHIGAVEYYLKGESLISSSQFATLNCRRVP